MRDALTLIATIAVIAAGLLIAAYFLRTPEKTGSVIAPPAESSDPIDRAWRVVHEAPRDPAGWAKLGEAQAGGDQLDSAEHSYRTAIRLGGGDGLAYARLGFLLYERGDDEQARVLLREAKRRGANVPMLDYTLSALEKKPEVAKRAADPTPDAGEPAPLDASVIEPPHAICELAPEKEGHAWLLPLEIGGDRARMVIDTGATISLLTRQAADRLRLPIDHEHVLNAITANGRVRFSTAVVPEIVLGGRRAEGVRVAVCENCLEQTSDGLMGLDLQAVFGLELRLGAGRVSFADCK